MLLPLHRMRRQVTQLPYVENRALFSFWLESLHSLYYESKKEIHTLFGNSGAPGYSSSLIPLSNLINPIRSLDLLDNGLEA